MFLAGLESRKSNFYWLPIPLIIRKSSSAKSGHFSGACSEFADGPRHCCTIFKFEQFTTDGGLDLVVPQMNQKYYQYLLNKIIWRNKSLKAKQWKTKYSMTEFVLITVFEVKLFTEFVKIIKVS